MFDAQQIFDGNFSTSPPTGVAITASRQSTNTLDLLAARDVAGGLTTTQLNVLVSTALAGATSLQVSVQVSPDAATWVTLISGPIIPAASLTAGRQILPADLPNNGLLNLNALPDRYLSLYYAVVGGPFTSGAVLAYMSSATDVTIQQIYPRNYNISA